MTAVLSSKASAQSVWSSLALSLRLAWSLGYIVAIPTVALGLGGAYVDKLYGTSPIFILIGFVLAAVIAGLGVYRKVKEILASPSMNHGRN